MDICKLELEHETMRETCIDRGISFYECPNCKAEIINLYEELDDYNERPDISNRK